MLATHFVSHPEWTVGQVDVQFPSFCVDVMIFLDHRVMSF